MSLLPLRKHVSRHNAMRLGAVLALLTGGAFALGASGPRAGEGVTVCTTEDAAAMVAAGGAYFAAHPAHGGSTSAKAVTATFTAQNFFYDADGNPLTSPDTVTINVGETVQFTRINGTHTTTSGSDGDVNAGSLWDLPLDATHPTQVVAFNAPGTFPFFCQIHTLNNMKGVIVVNMPAGIGSEARVGAGFVTSPAPNPSSGGGAVRFAVALAGRARVTAFDAGGRAVATVFDRELAPGTYAASWSGRSAAGGQLAPGAYFLRLTAPGVSQTRRITLVH